MRPVQVVGALASLSLASAQTASAKRGLVYVPSNEHPKDDQIWISGSSDLTWYYNYGLNPSPVFSNTKLQFVPQLWGAPPSANDTTFLDGVRAQIKGGANITYILTFNEPDSAYDGGSSLSAEDAAQYWMNDVEPLREQGVKLGAPAVTGAPSGFTWLSQFFTACNGKCHADFIPVHWYGNFEGMASHIGQVRGLYQNMSIWVTEFADSHDTLTNSQSFYNSSTQYLDRLEYVTRYSYFGAFRSDVSNVGPNAAFLTQNGDLTSIGSWYLGGSATGKTPKGAANRATFTAASFLIIPLAAFWLSL